MEEFQRAMEAPPWNRESEEKSLFDGYLLHHPDFEISGEDTSESFSAKRKVESSYGLFCCMRKRIRRHKSIDDEIFPDLEDCSSSGSESETDLSECSEFDVITEHVLEDMDLIRESTGSKSLTICNFPWPSEDEGTLVNKLSSETQNPILLISSDEVNEETGVIMFKEDVVVSEHSNDISLFHSEHKRDKLEVCEDSLRCRINKKDPEIQCNSDMFKDDGDKSSEIEVRYGDVVNMQASLEQTSSVDELRLWNKDNDPIPICSVPPAGQSSNILLETCSLHQNVSFDNEYNNVPGDHNGLEITPISLTKTIEEPSRSLSVCGSLAAGRNLLLVEDSSAACSSSENRDAELAQNPSALHQEEVDGEDKISFADIDALIHRLNLVPEDSDSCLNREEWNMSKHPRYTLLGLEHCTKTSTRRALVFQGAIAVLHCRDSKYYIRKHEVVIGRSSHGLNVDIDLGKDGFGSKISRRQALVKLEDNGSFSLKNLGKRHILLNGRKLNTEQTGTLASGNSIDFKGIVFEFKINKEAVRQFLKNNTRRNSEDDAKFRWCE